MFPPLHQPLTTGEAILREDPALKVTSLAPYWPSPQET